MDWLNYHHLHYFWLTATEGSLTAAARKLRLSPSTVSSQLKALEQSVGGALFDRSGRKLVLTDLGRFVLDYALEIFALGEELRTELGGWHAGSHRLRLRVGVANILPKWLAYRLLAPVFHLDTPIHLICTEDRAEDLVASLAVGHLDLVLSDTPVGLSSDVRAKSRVIGQSAVTVFGAPPLAAKYATDFPKSLDGAPFLLPGVGTTLRDVLEEWFDANEVRPHVVAEFGESALLKAFGQEGIGLFATPAAIREEVISHYGVAALGELEGAEERFWAFWTDRSGARAAIDAVVEAAARAL